MLTICRHCDTKLFGDERDAGVCKNCQIIPIAAKRRAVMPVGERSQSRPSALPGWGYVRAGAGLMAGGIMVVFLLVAVLLVLHVRRASMSFEMGLSLLGGVLLNCVMSFVALLLCCMTPREAGLRVRSVITMFFGVAYVASLAIFLVALFTGGLSGPEMTPEYWLLQGMALCFGLSLCGLLRGIAHAVGNPELGLKFLLFPIIAIVGPFVVAFVVTVGVAAFTGFPGVGIMAGVFATMVFALIMILWQFSLLLELRSTLNGE